jgi:hypothetical protein
MYDCGLSRLLSFSVRCTPPSSIIVNEIQRRQQIPQPTQIEICSRTKGNLETWEVAVLSCDPNTADNYISRPMLEVLDVPVHTSEKGEECIHANDRGEGVEGYVDLAWCFESNTKHMQKTRFWVTTTENPAYDVVLGRPDAEQCGLLRPRKHF